MRLLLLSNSTNPGEEYLSWPEKHVKKFLGSISENILFIPYAGVSIGWDDYYQKIQNRFSEWGFDVHSIHHSKNEKNAIKEADAILVGGGNTFNLLKTLQEKNLIEIIREKVKSGLPFIGWSAGSNLCCPTIRTTNDMPVVEPKSFNALNLIPFQINPHYTDYEDEKHGGETRDDRIDEFLITNTNMYVVGLREASLIKLTDGKYELLGRTAKIFKFGTNTVEPSNERAFDFLNAV